MADSDSIKLCECGCGQAAPIAKRSRLQRGWIRGEPQRFVRGHATRKHGHTHVGWTNVTYSAWSEMRARCRNIKHRQWLRYGGRGIRVCDSWANSYETFLADMGERPGPDFSLDRIDNDGNYEPSNCRWTDKTTQANNRRSNFIVTVNGQTATASQWARKFGRDPAIIIKRLRRGWTLERAVKEPAKTNY